MVLEDVEEFSLKGQRELANFVQEQSPFVGELEFPQLSPICTGKGPFLVAEQLGLEELSRESGAVHLYEGLMRSLGSMVDGVGHEFFACSAFASDQDSRISVGNPLDDFSDGLHGRAVA